MSKTTELPLSGPSPITGRCQGAHHEWPVEAGEALVELGGVGEQQEERGQELQQRSGDEGGRRRRHEAHKGQETQELRDTHTHTHRDNYTRTHR